MQKQAAKSWVRAKVRRPKGAAAGPKSVRVALATAAEKIGKIDGLRTLLRLNQIDGFDCPGCAWPDPLGHRSTFEFCENGAKAVADEATQRKVDAAFFANHGVDDLKQRSDRWLNEQGRLTEPMMLAAGDSHYRPVSWEKAFSVIAAQLQALHSPDQAAFYTSGRTSNEAAFLYQLFVRKFGTNNLPDCSNMCHESSGRALTDAIGVGKGTVSLEDLENAGVIFIFGQNPGSNHPRMLATLQRAKRNGARIISVNPLNETGLRRFKNPQEVGGWVGRGTSLADLHLPVRINGDVALVKGLIKATLALERAQPGKVLDKAFLAEYTQGIEPVLEDADRTSWQTIEQLAGVERALLERAAKWAAEAEGVIACWAMGLTQHVNAVANIQTIVNFLLLGGNLGKPGAGVCPVRGHSNVQGDRTMGIWERPNIELLRAIKEEFGFRSPQHAGVDTVDCVRAMRRGTIEVFFAMGGNFVAATPDDDYVAGAVANCRLTVQVSTKLNRSHVYVGREALILPALGRTDSDTQKGVAQIVTVENSMGVVQTSKGTLPPPSAQCRSEVWIVAQLARAVLGHEDDIPWQSMADDYALIRDRISRVIPGFGSFNERLRQQDEFVLPNAVRDHRVFNTDTKKANFFVHPSAAMTAPEGQFVMMSIRSHDQFNTTVYSNDDRYRGIRGSRRVVLINRKDMKAHRLKSGAMVKVSSHYDGQARSVDGFQLVSYKIPRGCVAMYYPECNPLIPIEYAAEQSNTPAYKSVIVSLKSS